MLPQFAIATKIACRKTAQISAGPSPEGEVDWRSHAMSGFGHGRFAHVNCVN